MRKLLWILSTVMLLGTLVTPSYVKADGNPMPTCPTGSTSCKHPKTQTSSDRNLKPVEEHR